MLVFPAPPAGRRIRRRRGKVGVGGTCIVSPDIVGCPPTRTRKETLMSRRTYEALATAGEILVLIAAAVTLIVAARML